MSEIQRTSFEAKAPLIDLEQLAQMLTSEIIASELLSQADSVWLFASFVNPNKEIDTGRKASDLDVFVRVPDWEMPIADSGIPIFASSQPTSDLYETMTDDLNWQGHDAPDRQWDCSPDEAWKSLPEPVQITLFRCTRKLFHATQEDREKNRGRIYDILIGNEVQFKWATYYDENDRLLIWENGSLVV